MSLNSVQSFVIDSCNGQPMGNGLNNVCLHQLSHTFTSRLLSKLYLDNFFKKEKDLLLIKPSIMKVNYRSYETGSIHGWSRSHLIYIPGDCWVEERKLTSQSPPITVNILLGVTPRSIQKNWIPTYVSFFDGGVYNVIFINFKFCSNFSPN